MRALGLVGFMVFLALVVWRVGTPSDANQILAALAIGIMLIHAILALGLVDAMIFLALFLGVTFAIENFGVATGFPYGRYHFLVGANLPHVGTIPLVVGFLYFGMGYPSWIIAGILVRRAGAVPETLYDIIALPIVAAFVMVQWDAVMDPSNATIGRLWVWHDGGGFFGVPLSNFLGWYLAVWAVFAPFAVYLLLRRARRRRSPQRSSAFWLVPVLLYLAAGLCWVTPYLAGGDALVRDGGGRTWATSNIREATVVVMLSTMVATSALATLRLFDRRRDDLS